MSEVVRDMVITGHIITCICKCGVSNEVSSKSNTLFRCIGGNNWYLLTYIH